MKDENDIVSELTDEELACLVKVARSDFLAWAVSWFSQVKEDRREAAVAMLVAFLIDQRELSLDNVLRYVEVYRSGHVAAFAAGRSGIAESFKA